MTKARSNAVANAAKGDLIVGSGTNTSAILAVGPDGSSIVADSSTSTGLRYTAGTVQGNPIINSSFQVWARGTSFTNGNSLTAYGADRWQIYSSNTTGRTWSRQSTNDTTNLPNIQYCQRLARNSGDTQTGIVYTIYNFETVNSIPFAGKVVTLSYYARAGANYSSASNVLNIGVLTGTGTDQNSLAGYTGTINSSFSSTLTTTWQRFTHTVAIGATATEIGIQIGYTPVGTAGANDWFEMTGVQMDIGSVALPFRTYAGTIQGELAACQRYYYRWTTGGNANAYIQSIFAYTTTIAFGTIKLPVTMRVNPTSIETSGTAADYRVLIGNTVGTNSAVPVLDNSGWESCLIKYTVASGLTVGQGGVAGANATNNAYIGFVAEL